MNTNNMYNDCLDSQHYREALIRELDMAENKTLYVKNNVDNFFALGLTMYSQMFSFDSMVFNSFSTSYLNENISLHPEQQKMINMIEENKGTVISAPTSFGKTFVIFEYIARHKPQNVILVVPTLALIDEYRNKIIKEHYTIFKEYKLYLSIEKEKKYDFSKKNLFIVTHDRVVSESVHEIIDKIDFLVIDEVYKLQRNKDDEDRVLILNLAYYYLVSISEKYVLLAPFISGIKNLNKLDDEPYFYCTNYSPVVSEVKTIPIIDEGDRFCETDRLLSQLNGNTLIYFPTVKELEDYIKRIEKRENPSIEYNEILLDFINWAKQEIHEKWSILKAMESGYLVHHGQLPLGIRILELDLFNNTNNYNKLLCTSTLLEGVNTVAENIIITKPCRGRKDKFDAFDFYNLVGRTGRLFKHYLGKAYYIKGPHDIAYVKSDATVSIEFELTTESVDIDINKGDYQKHEKFVEFLKMINSDYDSYKSEVSSKCRFKTVVDLYSRYSRYKNELIQRLLEFTQNPNISKLYLIRALYKIVNNNLYDMNIDTFIINKLTYLTNPRPSIKNVVNDTLKSFSNTNIDDLIKKTIRMKNSFIEHEFYKKIQIIVFFMKCENIDSKLIEILQERLMKNIEINYYINAPTRRMLKDMGVYDKDIDFIIFHIGDDFETVEELKSRLIKQQFLINRVSIVSKYVLKKLIE